MVVVLVSFQLTDSKTLQYPNYFPSTVYNFEGNPLSNSKIELGRALFYDPILSADSSISCASCHSPYNAFSHTDHELSHGINDEIGNRNAPALFNLAWQKSFMWDGAVNHLDVQALAPISHPKEMGESITQVVIKLQHSKLYPKLFKQAYGDTSISGEKLLKAISQFQLTLTSTESKYDEVKKGTSKFTKQERSGYTLFKNNCNSCHKEPLFSTYEFAYNGLELDPSLKDYGRWGITKEKKDSLQFKIPSLRNLSYSYPYMHDGRFRKLNEILNHYTGDINETPLISNELTKPIVLTPNEKNDLIAFLLTLNDSTFIYNTKNKFPKLLLLKNKG